MLWQMHDVSTSTEDALQEHFVRVASRYHVPGIAYGVVLDDTLSHSAGVGVPRVGIDVPPTADTPSRIASMTKSFTATACMILRDEGLVTLDAPVETYVPELRLTPSTGDAPRVTVRHLLSMASGLPEDDRWADRRLDVTREDVSALLANGATFARAPGVAFEYSNLGWVILGRALEGVAGEPVQSFISRRILEPLGLRSTTWAEPANRVMKGYGRRDEQWFEQPPPLGDGGFASIGGLWSTVRDVAAWIAFLMDAFPPRDDPDDGPLSRASRREMQQMHRAFAPILDEEAPRLVAGGYGFGLEVMHDLRFGTLVGHSGGLPGFASHMRWIPARKAGVVVLMNLTSAPAETVALETLELLDDLGAIAPASALEPSPQLRYACEALVKLLDAWDDEVADALFADNVFQDDPRDRRRGLAAALRDQVGGSLTIESIDAESATRASARLRGGIRLSVWLSPTVPPRIQEYEITETAASENAR
jgi:CubicO group peptidase (beta-lactamase class C family)